MLHLLFYIIPRSKSVAEKARKHKAERRASQAASQNFTMAAANRRISQCSETALSRLRKISGVESVDSGITFNPRGGGASSYDIDDESEMVGNGCPEVNDFDVESGVPSVVESVVRWYVDSESVVSAHAHHGSSLYLRLGAMGKGYCYTTQ